MSVTWELLAPSKRRFLLQRLHSFQENYESDLNKKEIAHLVNNFVGFPTSWYHTFVNIGPILTILVPIKSPWSWLLIGTNFVKIGSMLTKL